MNIVFSSSVIFQLKPKASQHPRITFWLSKLIAEVHAIYIFAENENRLKLFDSQFVFLPLLLKAKKVNFLFPLMGFGNK